MTATLLGSQAVGFADGNAGHVYTYPLGAPNAGELDVISVASATVVATPAGYTLAISNVGGQGAYIFYRKAVGGEAATTTITTTGDFNTSIIWSRWGNVTALDVTAKAAVDGVGGTSTPAVNTGPLAATNELVIAAACLHSGLPTAFGYSAGYSALVASPVTQNTSGGGAATVACGYRTDAGTTAETPSVNWTTNADDRYILVATFTTAAAPTLVSPDSLSIPLTLGAPTVSQALSVTPTSLSIPLTLGSPTITDGSMTITPDGLAVPITFGAPSVSGAPNPLSGDLVGPVATFLLDCLCASSERSTNPPQNCCFRVGFEPPADMDMFTDLCCEGLGFVAIGDVYPSRAAVQEDTDRQVNCGIVGWAVQLRMGIMRCLPTGGPNGSMPTCAQWTAAAEQDFSDSQVLRAATCCFLAGVRNLDNMVGMSVLVGRQSQTPPQGGCIERYVTFDVQFPNCDC